MLDKQLSNVLAPVFVAYVFVRLSVAALAFRFFFVCLKLVKVVCLGQQRFAQPLTAFLFAAT
ncbi:hypothetical protein DN548_09520 [Burkholderia multivorans]|nr:hypothetical protein DN515_15290 [Burkholderia multivorans]RAB68236.1 hypothetical protein DN568_09260 [Burkholderia multivorans]RAC89274.1 hypothetical protein DN498_01565 [Burkholderia multivorans]RAD60668.1 hypothetical protein DN548_09520 [Burkholderia multivorans]RAD99074.1 hypothetical protein DN508_00985 [Burkholderia multivorans]